MKDSLKINGLATVIVPFSTEINMNEEEFDSLTQLEQDDLIEMHMDWNEYIDNESVELVSSTIEDAIMVNPDTGMPLECQPLNNSKKRR